MEKTTLKDVSREFGMKANEFAGLIGYTPQALNAALRSSEVDRHRMYMALKKLNETSNEMYLNQTKEVLIAKSRREQVLASLAKWFGMSWD
ncbi:MAG: hypothetical protein ACRCVY_09875 [Commensalibacter sp.]